MCCFFDDCGWLEVEMFILQFIYGGVVVWLFKIYYNMFDMLFYMWIVNEFYFKCFIVGGFEGVYEIGKMF